MKTITLAHALGFFSLSSYIFTLLPTILRIVFPRTERTGIPKLLLIYRRQIGLIAFGFAIGHSLLMIVKINFDFFDLKTYWIYIQGVVTLIIFTLLGITSNNWSIKKLKKNWKRLHSLTYLAMFFLTWHIWDKMYDQWSFLTPLALILIVGITVLFMLRKWLEYRKR